MKKTIYYILMLHLLICSCSSDESLVSFQSGIPFTIDASQYASCDSTQTRVTVSNGVTNSFEDGDAVGIYIVADNSVVYSNLKFLCMGSWKNDTYGRRLPFVENAKYFAYYPYQSTYTDANVTPSATTAEAFFAPMISAWNPATDQSSKTKFELQDLMISLGTAMSSGYNFSMAHQMSRLEVDLPQVLYSFINSSATQYKYTFSNYTPYNYSDGAYYLIVKPGTTVSGQVCDQVGTKINNWSFTVGSDLKGYYQKAKINSTAAGLTSTKVSPAVGNIYYSDGSYGSSYNSAKTPIGVVVSTNSTYCEPTNYGHGLVMALKNASTASAWCLSSAQAYTSDKLTNVTTGALWKSNASGLSNTNVIKGLSDYSPANYPAFVAATTYAIPVAAPTSTSRWFLASSGQWLEAMTNAQNYYNQKNGSSKAIPYTTWGTSGSLGKIGAYSSDCSIEMTYLFNQYSGMLSTLYTGIEYSSSIDHQYWNSSEYSSSNGCSVDTGTDGYLYMNNYYNKTASLFVRSFLAF